MPLKIIITGGTGMVGKGVLMYCLDDNRVATVLSISRSPLGISHPKLREIILNDFELIDNYKSELVGFDACYFCLGTSSVSMTESVFTKITYNLTINFAKVLKESSPDAVFCYVSGEGTDSTEQGKTMWARVKGRTENDLLKMGFRDAYMFRPGFIRAMRGAKSKTKLYAFFYIILKPFFPLIMLSKKYATDTDRIAKAMLSVSLNPIELKHLNTYEINKAAEG